MHLHWHIWDPNLTDYELDRVVDFLKTLTDETFTPAIPAVVPSGLEPVGVSPLTDFNSHANKRTTVAGHPAAETSVETRGASS